jgi:hypothetical protein
MSLAGVVRLVLADGVSTDQERALAAVMLGLVVFAAVFALVERQRRRRAREAREDPPADQAGASDPAAGPDAEPAVNPDPPAAELYQPPHPTTPAGIVPDPMPVVLEPVPAPAPTEDHASVPAPPASPDEIGIVIPDDQPPPAPQEPPPAG